MSENKTIAKLQAMKQDKKGFTLVELLIVVAIIAILIAIAVPTFTSSLDKANAATDDANLRSAKAVANAAALTGEAAGATITTSTYYFDPSDGTLKTSKVTCGKSATYKDKAIEVKFTQKGQSWSAAVAWEGAAASSSPTA